MTNTTLIDFLAWLDGADTVADLFTEEAITRELSRIDRFAEQFVIVTGRALSIAQLPTGWKVNLDAFDRDGEPLLLGSMDLTDGECRWLGRDWHDVRDWAITTLREARRD